MKEYKDYAGVILAGGKSSRIGSPKESLMYKKKKLYEIILEIFNSLFDEMLIVTDNQRRFPELEEVKIVEDLVKNKGPLVGIYTGLKSISKSKAFFVACDMPLLQPDLIKKILTASQEDDCECVVPCTSKGIEPLHAVYSNKIIPRIEHLLKGKDLSVRKLLNNCKCKYINLEKQDEPFLANINTLEDLKKLQNA